MHLYDVWLIGTSKTREKTWGFCFENWKRAPASNGRLCPPAGPGAAHPPQVLQLFACTRRDVKRWEEVVGGCGWGPCLRTTPGAGGSTDQATRRCRLLLLPQPLYAVAPKPNVPPRGAPHAPATSGFSQQLRAL